MVPSIRSFRSSKPPQSYKDPQLSPTLTATTSASAFEWGEDGAPRVIVTRADLRASVAAYENLLAAAKSYRNAMLALSSASTAFAGALEECARVKGAGESGEQLLAASGLQYMVANSGQVLSDTLYRSFEIPLLHAYDTYVATTTTRHAEYEALLAERTAAIRQTEADNLKQGRKKSRDLSQFRRALEKLQEQVREVEAVKKSYYNEVLDHETETWELISGKVSLVLRSTLDLSDRLASKATSDPTIESMLNEHPDPFDSYRTENEEERDVFTVLPPLGMNLGLGGSKRGSVIDLDKEAERAGDRLGKEDSSTTLTPRQASAKKAPVSVADVLGINAGTATDSAEDTEPESADEERLETTPRHTHRHHPPPPPHDNPFASTSSSPTPASSSGDSPSALTSAPFDSQGAEPDSPSPARVAASGLSVRTQTPKKGKGKSRRAQLSRVSETENDPMAGDWGVPEYGRNLSPVMNGNGEYDSGDDEAYRGGHD